jgi:hypothetical protein
MFLREKRIGSYSYVYLDSNGPITSFHLDPSAEALVLLLL